MKIRLTATVFPKVIASRNFEDRPHSFQTKTIVMPEACHLCSKRIGFGKTALKCKDCKTVCHPECKNLAPLPCATQPNTPKNAVGLISDYTPANPPMVPTLLIHCIKEIENRGLDEVGLYRVSGAEREVRMLKEKLLKGKGAPQLINIDIHAVCGTVKDFLRSLQEPLVPQSMWKRFVNAISDNDVKGKLQQAVENLPQPNRDTLAYLILHLQKVSQRPNCMMNVDNLAKIFGITLLGHSCKELTGSNLMKEIVLVTKVMEQLIGIEKEFWERFLEEEHFGRMRMQPTGSTDSLLQSGSKNGFFTPKR